MDQQQWVDMSAVWDAAKWVIGALGGVVTLIIGGLGIAKLREIKRNRLYILQDELNEIHKTDAGAKINAEISLVKDLFARVYKLEIKDEKIQALLMTLSTTNATLTSENEHLKEDKTRQDEAVKAQGVEISDLRKRNRELGEKVVELTNVVHRLEIRISELTGHPLEVTLVEGEIKEIVDENK